MNILMFIKAPEQTENKTPQNCGHPECKEGGGEVLPLGVASKQ